MAKSKNYCKQRADGHIDVLIGCVKKRKYSFEKLPLNWNSMIIQFEQYSFTKLSFLADLTFENLYTQDHQINTNNMLRVAQNI